jgi:signal transduction histidine kinase
LSAGWVYFDGWTSVALSTVTEQRDDGIANLPARRDLILIVEDDREIREALASILEREGYRTCVAAHGAEALELLTGDADRPHLIVLDLMMPVMNGWQLRAALKQDLTLAAIPVIALSANKGAEAIAIDADAFIAKPVDLDALLDVIEDTLQRADERAHFSSAYQRQARHWQISARVAEAVAASRNYEQILQALSAALAEELPFDSVSFIELEPDQAVVVATCGPDDALVPDARARSTLARFTPLRASGTLVLDDVTQSPWQADRELAKTGVRALVRVPLSSGGELVGVLSVARRRPFDAEDVALLETVGPHLAHAIANVRAQLRLAELAALKERMSVLLVHDLKNPLSILKVNLDMLQEYGDLAEGDRREIIADARAATHRLLGMVVDLLDIGRAEESKLQVQLVPSAIALLCNEIIERFRLTAAQRAIRLTLQVPPTLVADVDAKLFQRILENILSNALRYTPERGEVVVSGAAVGDRVRLALENDGPSIPEPLRKSLFQKYGQLQENGRQYNRGLGLYFCRLVVEAHGGTISAHDREGGGVRFEIEIPRSAMSA